MKKIILISSIFLFCLLISVSHTYAQSSMIAGWWKTRISIQQGHFETGTWDSIQARGKHSCYLWIVPTTSLAGAGYLALWDALNQKYILETYNLYIRNDIAVLVIPTSLDADGNLISGATIVLRLSGGPNIINSMTGYYTLFDIESESTPPQFVRMGPVDAIRVNPNQVPKDAMDLVFGQPLP